MPLLQVKALPQNDPTKIQPALKAACAAVAKAYGCETSNVWANWVDIKPGHYVEGDHAAFMQPEKHHPPIAELICFEGKSQEVIEACLLAFSGALTEGLGIPDNIFLTYTEAKSGRTVSGNGKIRRA
ncbi:MAG: hypothetical protein ABL958_14525 [Bdellovibrionia bacterium]